MISDTPRAARAGHSDLLLELQIAHVHDEVRVDRRLDLADQLDAGVDDEGVVRLDHRALRQPLAEDAAA